MATQTEKYALGSITTVGSTALNSLANNTNVSLTVFDNTQGQTGDGYTLADIELTVTFGTNPTANTGFSLWLLASADGTNYEAGSSSVTPARLPDVVFPVIVTTSAQTITRRVSLPWGKMTPLLRNDGTGQTIAASGNTLKIRPATRQSV